MLSSFRKVDFPRHKPYSIDMRRAGFSLIELIAVIGIMSALIAILIPYLNRSRLQTRAVVCMSNIRQLNSVFSAYTTDSGRFPYGFDDLPAGPPAGGYAGINSQPVADKAGWWWFNYLKGIHKNNMSTKTVLQCPSKQLQQAAFRDDILCGNYGANLSICKMSEGIRDQNEFIGKPLDVAQIAHPSQTLLLVDSGYAIISWRHATDAPPVTLDSSNIENTAYIPGLSINCQRQLKPEEVIDAVYGRHPQLTVNVGFADGHVARIKAEDLLVKKAADGHYQNQYPLWTPDAK